MKAIIRLEMFGYDMRQWMRLQWARLDSFAPGMGKAVIGKLPSPGWVAEITGRDATYGLARRFLRGNLDYSEANSVGSRGIFLEVVLESGHVYEIKRKDSWRSSRRYFATVTDDGTIAEMNRDEVDQWLNDRSA